MGIFDRFKKDKPKQENKIAEKKNDIDLSNPIIKKMVDWIEHPMEFGKKPDSISIANERILFWPNNQKEKCYLMKFVVDNTEYIGFTGPTTWCFIGIDFKGLSFESLYERYTGWFIAFFSSQSENYEKEKEGLNESKVIDKLMKSGMSEIKTLQKVYLGGDTYYEFLADEGGQKIKVVGTESDLNEFKSDYLLPFFQVIGIGWDPLNL